MRVLQLIDSLRPGGAEQMAVSYANALARRGQDSFLCCTRMEGPLKKKLNPDVGYLFLNKKHSLDRLAYFKLRNFVKDHQVQIIQAHSSSYFLAVFVKLSFRGLKVIWHDHYGKDLGKRRVILLKVMSRWFDGVISVNKALKSWAQENLETANIVYLKNFVPDFLPSFDKLRMGKEPARFRVPKLLGGHEIKIICVANLRPQKDHFNLLKAFKLVMEAHPEVSLHLVGKDEDNKYSQELKSFISDQDLKENIFLYGEQENVEKLVKQANIGVLSSSSEGLPVALLEYGRAGIPVICTRVGEIPDVVGSSGVIVNSADPKALAEAILFYMKKEDRRNKDAFAFNKRVMQEYSENVVIPQLMAFYSFVLK